MLRRNPKLFASVVGTTDDVFVRVNCHLDFPNRRKNNSLGNTFSDTDHPSFLHEFTPTATDSTRLLSMRVISISNF